MDRNKHLFFMRKLLREFYCDPLLAGELRFKGGTAAMFFHGLPRFSTDLDFNLVNIGSQAEVYQRIQEIVSSNGRILDMSNKRFGPVVVLDYGAGERKLKVEVSNRLFDSHYSLMDMGALKVPVLEEADMFTHKLCAMRERKAPRDVFDVWYFLSKGWAVNPYIVKERTGLEVSAFMEECRSVVSGISSVAVMKEIGELLDNEMKDFVRKRLIDDTVALFGDFLAYPLLSESVPCEHTSLLLANGQVLPGFTRKDIDPSTVSVESLSSLLNGGKVVLLDKVGKKHSVRFVGGKLKFGKEFNPGNPGG